MDFLQEYGESEARRELFVKSLAITLIAVVLLGLIYYVFFRNWRAEWQVRSFLSLLQGSKYEQAYALWGCSKEEPCQYYSWEAFLEDWGPRSPIGKVESYELRCRMRALGLLCSYPLENGVIIPIMINGKPESNLWVEAGTTQVGFSPY